MLYPPELLLYRGYGAHAAHTCLWQRDRRKSSALAKHIGHLRGQVAGHRFAQESKKRVTLHERIDLMSGSCGCGGGCGSGCGCGLWVVD